MIKCVFHKKGLIAFSFYHFQNQLVVGIWPGVSLKGMAGLASLTVLSWSKTHIFAAQLLKKSISTQPGRENENNSQYQSNKITE